MEQLAQQKKSKRNVMIDVLKGVAIVLVVFGHCMQNGMGPLYTEGDQILFWEDWAVRIVYSFHMPLFMLLSGYLFWFSSTRRSAWENMKQKALRLLVPIFAWGATAYVAKIVLGQANIDLFALLQYCASQNWFLWAVLFCTVVTLFGKGVFKDNYLFFAMITIAMAFVPSVGTLPECAFVMPYFFIGYLVAKHKETLLNKLPGLFTKKGLRIFTLAVVIVWAVLMPFYDVSSYVYISNMWILTDNVPQQLLTDVYRFAVGLVGGAGVILVFKVFWPKGDLSSLGKAGAAVEKILVWFGKNTLGVYVFTTIFCYNVLRPLTAWCSPNLLLACGETVVVLVVGYVVIKILSLWKVTRVLYLGSSK